MADLFTDTNHIVNKRSFAITFGVKYKDCLSKEFMLTFSKT